jgi:F-type H+-transporting ATPase subunit b
MDKLGINLGFLLFQIFNFSILAILLYAFAYKPIVKMLENRKAKIMQSLEDARIAAEARANAEQEAAKIIAEAKAMAARLVNDATERADAAMEDVKAEAKKEITKEREAVMGDVEEERNRILADLRGQVAALAIAAAQRLIGEVMDTKRQHALLDEFFSGVRSGEVVVLEGADLTGDSAVVTSALPLSKEEQVSIKKNVLDKMGERTNLEFCVDPQILGGLVIRIGDKVLDGSVSGQLEEMRKSLR